jgi:hypothetical protein
MRDTIVDGLPAKVIGHYGFYKYCDNSYSLTCIRQSGDTIFLRNGVTSGSWQILFNFATTVGQAWGASLFEPIQKITLNYLVTVESALTFTDNNVPYRRMVLKYDAFQGNPPSQVASFTAMATERWGGSISVFNYDNLSSGYCTEP